MWILEVEKFFIEKIISFWLFKHVIAKGRKWHFKVNLKHVDSYITY